MQGRNGAEPAKVWRGTIVELIDVNKWFGDFHVLRDISLKVGRGEKVVICGPSGSGKSTLIRCVNRLEEHQEGRIVVDGTELNADMRNIEQVRRRIGMVFQQFNLFPHLSVMENLTLGPVLAARHPASAGRWRGRANCSSACASPTRPPSIRASCPAASSSGSPSLAR